MRSLSPPVFLILLAGLFLFLSPLAQADYTLWHSPLNYSTADDLTTRPYYNTSALVVFPMPQVPGLFSVQFTLTLPSNVEIDALTICYRGFSSQNSISRIELNQMNGPTTATIIYEEDVDLDDTADACYTSIVGGIPVEGTVTLTLDFNFGYQYDSILVGAIGIHVSELVSDVDTDWHAPTSSSLRLEPNCPNPFVPPTMIEYSLAEANRVSVEVLDPAGRHIRALFQGDVPQGKHRISWDGIDNLGHQVPAGQYFYRVRTHEEVASRGMILLR